MAEYIEREAAMLQIDAADFVRDDNFEGGATLLFCDDVVDRLSAIPAADVREVVLCRDCEMASPCSDDREMYCTLNHCYKKNNYFCADGRRGK